MWSLFGIDTSLFLELCRGNQHLGSKSQDSGIMRCDGRVVWGSLQGLKLTKEGWAEQLNPHGHGFIVQGNSVFKCVGVEPGTNSGSFEEIWMLVACFSV